MFGVLRNLSRPFVGIGRKLGNFFRLGRKVSPLAQDARNVMEFENLAQSGLRQRKIRPSDIMSPEGGFYGNMEGYLSNYKYPN
jgi:hypothetical protein